MSARSESSSPDPRPETTPEVPTEWPSGLPPLRPFGLVLHHDARFSHEGEPILNRKLREHFERSVAYLPEEKKYIVVLGHFRGEVEIEEAGFFVRSVDLDSGQLVLSDQTRELLDVSSLKESSIDRALLCRVKHDLAPEGLLARFVHSAQAELLQAVESDGDGYVLRIAGESRALPAQLAGDGV